MFDAQAHPTCSISNLGIGNSRLINGKMTHQLFNQKTPDFHQKKTSKTKEER